MEIIKHSENKESDSEWEPDDSDNESLDYEETDNESYNESPPSKKQKPNDQNWKTGSFVPKIFDLDDSESEVSSEINGSDVSRLHFFQFFFDGGSMSKIVNETNRYNGSIIKKERKKSKIMDRCK